MSNLTFSSCSPTGALAAGVKIGSGSSEPSCSPGGSSIPQSWPVARQIAAERGIILADTKFEFGNHPCTGELVLADEVLTPDSSRFWPADEWQPGRRQPSYDKQYVRDWLTSADSGWDRHSGEPPPPLPDEVVAATRARYLEAYERLTGESFADWPGR